MKVRAHWVPRDLAQQQKQTSVVNIRQSPHPPHSPEMAPSDYALFDIKDALRGERLSSQEKRQAAVYEWYRNNTKQCFREAIRKLRRKP
jgi:hypothetical protein